MASWVGSDPGVCGSVMLKALCRSPASSGCSQRSFCSSVPFMREDLGVAGVGGGVAERERGDRRGAEDLVHQAEADLAHALAAELLGQVGGPQAALLDLLLQRAPCARISPSRPSSGQIVSSGQISRRTRSRIQSSCSWKSGSVEKSQLIARVLSLGHPGEVESEPTCYQPVALGKARQKEEQMSSTGQIVGGVDFVGLLD